MITANSRRPHCVDTASSRLTMRDLEARDDERHDEDTLLLRDLHSSEPLPLDVPTTRRFPRTAAEAFRGPDYSDPLDGFPSEQPDPFASFEGFLDWIDARWKTWFAFAIAAGAALALITLFFAKGGTSQ